jgi:hypothetical protein
MLLITTVVLLQQAFQTLSGPDQSAVEARVSASAPGAVGETVALAGRVGGVRRHGKRLLFASIRAVRAPRGRLSALTFPIVNRFCMALLYGCAWRLTAENG